MLLLYDSLATVTILCLLKYASAIYRQGNEELYQKPNEEEVEIQQKVPLVDIVFTNGQKRTCTGAIIHENVVVTAGHCFTNADQGSPPLQPELTTSFVVIGTQKKFQAGYEQYLPIEKVIMHPNKKGWSADIALVTTFASMTSENVGAVMPLADEKDYASIENSTNKITIMSWGPILKDKNDAEKQSYEINSNQEKTHKSDFADSCVSDQRLSDSEERNNNDNDEKHTQTYKNPLLKSTQIKMFRNGKKSALYSNENSAETLPQLLRGLTQTKTVQKPGKAHLRAKLKPTTKIMSRYLSTYLEKIKPSSHNRHDKVNQNKTYDSDLEDYILANLTTQDYSFETTPRALTHKTRKNNHRKRSKRYQNFRRQLEGQQVNKMTVQNFEFVNSYACKKMLEKADRWNEIRSTDEILCYTSDSHYVSDADSGAPAIYQGHLLAITVGGVDSEGKRVAVAMNIGHFCPWIAENLPATDTQIKCATLNNEEKDVQRSHKHVPKIRPGGREWMISAEY